MPIAQFSSPASSSRRRRLLVFATTAAALSPFSTKTASATDTDAGSSSNTQELPMFLRDYTKLAPLGSSSSSKSDAPKNDLTLEEIASRLQNDLVYGSSGTEGGYFITGDLSPELFDPNCIFVDPTNRVSSLNQYQNALRILFDPNMPFDVQLLTSPVVDVATNTISTRIRSRGYLQLPWHPYITSYESQITYTIDANTNLIVQQEQSWSKSAYKALKESFTPSFFTPPPQSALLPLQNEPSQVTQLFQYLNGRRPYEYSTEEREEIDALIESIAKDSSSNYPYQKDLLPGTWILVYLQPGPNNAGIDRRIPFFPELDFNDNYQVFTKDDDQTTTRITNIGQVWGPTVSVQVSGTVQEVSKEDTTTSSKNQRLQATISGGKLCLGETTSPNNTCQNLPISGEGLFESVYLGNRLRIGQNLNGGGARIVQIRLM